MTESSSLASTNWTESVADTNRDQYNIFCTIPYSSPESDSTIQKAPQASLHHGILTSVYIDSKLLKARLFGVPIDGFRNLAIKESKIIDLEMLGSLREVFTVPNSAAGEPKMTYIGLSQRHPPRVGGCSGDLQT